MAYYASRSLLAYKLTFNKRMHPDEPLDVEDLEGVDLLDHIERFCEEAIDLHELIAVNNSNKFMQILRCDRDQDGILVTLSSGIAGDDVNVIDTVSGKEIYQYDSDKASMVTSRCYIPSLYSKGYALCFVEHTRHGAGDTALFTPFKSYLKRMAKNVVMRSPEAVTEAETLESFIAVESIEIQRYLEAEDITDTLITEASSINVKLFHKRGKRFGMDLAKTIMGNNKKAAALLGIKDTFLDDERSDVIVTLQNKDGRTKQFTTNQTLDMKFYEILNSNGQHPFNDERFIATCQENNAALIIKLGRKID